VAFDEGNRVLPAKLGLKAKPKARFADLIVHTSILVVSVVNGPWPNLRTEVA
jgi:hypothetical protein